jgi:hypothetical protein
VDTSPMREGPYVHTVKSHRKEEICSCMLMYIVNTSTYCNDSIRQPAKSGSHISVLAFCVFQITLRYLTSKKDFLRNVILQTCRAVYCILKSI